MYVAIWDTLARAHYTTPGQTTGNKSVCFGVFELPKRALKQNKPALDGPQQRSISYGTLDPDKARILFLLHFHISSDTHISTVTVVGAGSFPFFPTAGQAQDSASYLNSEFPHGANGDARDWSVVVGGDDGAFLGAPNTRHALGREQGQPPAQRNKHNSKENSFGLTLPQSLRDEELADAIFCFFLLSFNFSPAKTTSLASFRHSGQYLKSLKINK